MRFLKLTSLFFLYLVFFIPVFFIHWLIFSLAGQMILPIATIAGILVLLRIMSNTSEELQKEGVDQAIKKWRPNMVVFLCFFVFCFVALCYINAIIAMAFALFFAFPTIGIYAQVMNAKIG